MNTQTLPAVEGPVDRHVRPRPDDGDIAGTLSKALRRAYSLGQTYWQQADSDSYAQNRRSEETQRKFDALVDEVRDALFSHCKVVAETERHACSIAVWMTKMDATDEDADDLGVAGWLEEAEQRVKNRSANDPDVVVGAMVDDVRCKALQDAARWVDEEIGHAIQDGWSVEAVQALMATRDMLRAHADMHATTVERRR